MADVEAVRQRLLDFSQPFDVALLDTTVQAFYQATDQKQREAAQKVLAELQDHPNAWMRVDQILSTTSVDQSRYFALRILESAVKFRWGIMSAEQREGVRNYISDLIIKQSSDAASFRNNRMFISKLNVILVQILKHDWPARWPSFIPDIVGASRTSETLCQNSMQILKLLSEEIFDFSRGELTQAKTDQLKKSLNQEFMHIYQLCMYVLTNPASPELTRATLDTLHVYLTWVPYEYIFESDLLTKLLQLFSAAEYQNVALRCLAEVAGLKEPKYESAFVTMYGMFIKQLHAILPPHVSLAVVYNTATDEQQIFIQNLALFLTSFFRQHISLLEPLAATQEEHRMALYSGLNYLLNISYVEDIEVFKVCLDYWNYFVPDVYSSSCALDTSFNFGSVTAPSAHNRKALYAELLSGLRMLMICRMAKPEEVLIVEDEDGRIVREQVKDTDVLAQYKTMRETLVYLAHLDHDDCEHKMLSKLDKQLTGEEWSWNSLNTLCWAIGSISGSMQEEQENKFLVTVIRHLLNLCEQMRGKDNKAVIASNIMYVVGQYPRFLRQHWKFLKTVVNKLFEFMHETHPGVQDMACDTFLKICQKCKRKFIIVQPAETRPFIAELLDQLTTIIHDLQLHQIYTFYEAVGLVIGAEGDGNRRAEYLVRLMAPPNATWTQIIAQAKASPDLLRDAEVMKRIHDIIHTNVSVCSSLGQPFTTQMMLIYHDMLQVYQLYSNMISEMVATGAAYVTKSTPVRLMRSVKKITLKLLETFIEKSDGTGPSQKFLAEEFIPPLMEPVLRDYAQCAADARESEVLSLFAIVIAKLGTIMAPEVPRIFENTFSYTVDMIKANLTDYPEHRIKFFTLLKEIVNHCFQVLFTLTPEQVKIIMDSIFWAIRHTERNVADTGLTLLLDMLNSMQQSEAMGGFHQVYYMVILQEIFAVMTDTFHKPGLKMHAKILHHMFSIVQHDVIKVPLWNVAAEGSDKYPNNTVYVHGRTVALLQQSFPNMTPAQVETFVAGMFVNQDFRSFKHHLRDFLVQTKLFASQDNSDLFADELEAQRRQQEEARKRPTLPGMMNPYEMPEADGMVDA